MEESNIQKMRNILNLFGLGRIKFSATISSIIALAVYFTLRPVPLANISLFVVLTILTIFLGLRINNLEDKREIVIDEFLGMLLLLLIATPGSLFIGVVLLIPFRILDLIKIPPFSTIDKNVKGIWGIILDDLLIGLFIGLIFLIFF